MLLHQSKWKSFPKRLLDIVGSLLGIITFFVPMIIVAGLIYLKMGRPIFFTQTRPGKNQKLFKIYKFRTMLDAKDENGILHADEKRLSPFGQVLRSLSLDEVPQFFNVLKGDMSLVGPRPFLPEYIPFYTKEQNQRHLVRPGMTGWAQIHGRNDLTWPEKFSLDVWYVKNQSFLLDLKIIFITIKKVLKREGISHDGCATMPRFDKIQSLPHRHNCS